jgi:hypothetical protein
MVCVTYAAMNRFIMNDYALWYDSDSKEWLRVQLFCTMESTTKKGISERELLISRISGMRNKCGLVAR